MTAIRLCVLKDIPKIQKVKIIFTFQNPIDSHSMRNPQCGIQNPHAACGMRHAACGMWNPHAGRSGKITMVQHSALTGLYHVHARSENKRFAKNQRSKIMGVARIFFRGGETLFQKNFQKILKKYAKNFQKIFQKNSKKIPKNFKKYSKLFKKKFFNFKKISQKFS